ncbi:hypothetical protein B0H19DRAFT_1034411 [Mycena capillaripes]|nr:hypothetical protein B0H19DRAFT_1035558 [Mycena capillaripes]KAJ6544068.1 hypothetical protein B0H19DRAFT_1034411 [Mycena capillaripes]
MSIPGSAVTVEQVLSGGRDTISLRRSSLKPLADTIQTLILLKYHLRLKHKVLEDAIQATEKLEILCLSLCKFNWIYGRNTRNGP